MNGKILLDTSVAVEVLRGNTVARERVRQLHDAYLPLVALGELWYGVARAFHPGQAEEALRKLLEVTPVLPMSVETCRLYARIRADLAERGLPLPENDLWIAASALEYELSLATADEHFARIADLHLHRW
jgi:tRNA(fMet)-specific endonuclease VapC